MKRYRGPTKYSGLPWWGHSEQPGCEGFRVFRRKNVRFVGREKVMWPKYGHTDTWTAADGYCLYCKCGVRSLGNNNYVHLHPEEEVACVALCKIVLGARL